MEWEMVTWGLVLGMVGLLWVMAMAVMDEDRSETSSKSSSSEESGSDKAVEGMQRRERNAA